mmetsp:Transcript_18847/g.18005  ORF Transcript_18847/g.18005 Transcript_18847/m.18005 type:complete len:160 (-) Transcript_18847:363-842(-)
MKIYSVVESSEPLYFKDIKEHLESSIGYAYGDFFWLVHEGEMLEESAEVLMNDMLDSVKIYDLHFNTNNLVSDVLTNMIQNEKPLALKKMLKFTDNQMIIDEKFHVYHIMNYTEQQDTNEILSMNAIKFNMTERAKYEKDKMFILDEDDDPLNGRMLFF